MIRVVEYSYDSSHLDDVMEQVKDHLTSGGQVLKVSSVAVVLHSSERELFLCQVQIFFFILNGEKIRDSAGP